MDRKSESKSGSSTYNRISRAISFGGDEEGSIDIEAAYGRDPRDKEGEASTCWRSSQRVAEIFAYYCLCGCLLERLDRSYSAATENKPVVGEARKLSPGTSHLTTDFINTSLTLREADEREKVYLGFAHRYFKQSDIWGVIRRMRRTEVNTPEFKKLEELFEARSLELSDQLYVDSTTRRRTYDKSGKNIAALGMFMALLGLTIGLVNSYLNQNSNSDAVADVNYAQTVISAIVAYVIKMVTSYQSETGRAVQNFDGFSNWITAEIKRLECEIMQMKEAGRLSAEMKNIETQLNALKEMLLQAGFAITKAPGGQTSLLDAVATLIPESKDSLSQRFLSQQHDVAAVAEGLGCPIMVLSEADDGHDHQYQMFNEVLEHKSEQVVDDKAEEEVSANVSLGQNEPELPRHPENYLLLYTNVPNEYHPIHPPFAFNKPMSFANAKQALIELIDKKNSELHESSAVAQAKM